MVLSDAFRFPYLLLQSTKHEKGCKIKKVGNVSEDFNKDLGRPVVKLNGTISSNNYIEYSNLGLGGKFLYIKLRLIKPILATFHLDIVTADDRDLRITVSTIYGVPRFLETSLRLPLPRTDDWMILALDMDKILTSYCLLTSSSRDNLSLKFIKKFQFCSSMILREVVTSDISLSPNTLDLYKEGTNIKLAGNSSTGNTLLWIDLCSQETIGVDNYQNSTFSRSPNPSANGLLSESPTARSVVFSDRNKVLSTSPPFGSRPETNFEVEEQMHVLHKDMTPTKDCSPKSFNSYQNTKSNISEFTKTIKRNNRQQNLVPNTFSPSHYSSGDIQSYIGLHKDEESRRQSFASLQSITESHQIQSLSKSPINPDVQRGEHEGVEGLPKAPAIGSLGRNRSWSSPVTVTSVHPHSVGGRPGLQALQETLAEDRILSLDRMLQYAGGPSLLLYQGLMLVVASGPILVLIDVRSAARDVLRSSPTPGFWKAFSDISPQAGRPDTAPDAVQQACLRGHTSDIGILKVSNDGRLMLSCETSSSSAVSMDAKTGVVMPGPGPQLFLWDVLSGQKVSAFSPHMHSVSCAEFNTDASLLVTLGLGTDVSLLKTLGLGTGAAGGSRRMTQAHLLIWDVQQLLRGSKGGLTGAGADIRPIAWQLADFPINCLQFMNVLDQKHLPNIVSCGKENIRFWRIRQGHLPGRPVVLKQYGYGFDFTAINVHDAIIGSDKEPKLVSHIFVASSKGILLKINFEKEEVVAAYQLHSGPISSLAIHQNFMVTGGADSHLRVWPLCFTDYLLEAHHEGQISLLSLSADGTKVAVGTTVGTLGVLDLSLHSYRTVLRSHVGCISCVVAYPPSYQEFVTVGQDGTIRGWDVLTGLQLYEFNAVTDEALIVAYHPSEYTLACGFSSGILRIFDIESTSVIFERHQRKEPLTSLLYTKHGDLLLTGGVDSTICVYDCQQNYQLIRTMYTGVHVGEKMTFTMTTSGILFAVCGSSVDIIVVYDTRTLIPVLKTAVSNTNITHNTSANTSRSTAKTTSDSMAAIFGGTIQTAFSSTLGSTSSGGALGGGATTTSTLYNTWNRSKVTLTVPLSLNHPSQDGKIIGIVFAEDTTSNSATAMASPHLVLLILTSNRIIIQHISTSTSSSRHNEALVDAIESTRLYNLDPAHNVDLTAATTIFGSQLRSPMTYQWGGRRSKRLEFQNPTGISLDQATGLLFIQIGPATAPSTPYHHYHYSDKTFRKSKQHQSSILSSNLHPQHPKVVIAPPCLAIFHLQFRSFQSRDNVPLVALSFSVPQLYSNISSTLTAVCPCTVQDRIVMVDANGYLGIWTIDNVKLIKWQNNHDHLKSDGDIDEDVCLPTVAAVTPDKEDDTGDLQSSQSNSPDAFDETEAREDRYAVERDGSGLDKEVSVHNDRKANILHLSREFEETVSNLRNWAIIDSTRTATSTVYATGHRNDVVDEYEEEYEGEEDEEEVREPVIHVPSIAIAPPHRWVGQETGGQVRWQKTESELDAEGEREFDDVAGDNDGEFPGDVGEGQDWADRGKSVYVGGEYEEFGEGKEEEELQSDELYEEADAGSTSGVGMLGEVTQHDLTVSEGGGVMASTAAATSWTVVMRSLESIILGQQHLLLPTMHNRRRLLLTSDKTFIGVRDFLNPGSHAILSDNFNTTTSQSPKSSTSIIAYSIDSTGNYIAAVIQTAKYDYEIRIWHDSAHKNNWSLLTLDSMPLGEGKCLTLDWDRSGWSSDSSGDGLWVLTSLGPVDSVLALLPWSAIHPTSQQLGQYTASSDYQSPGVVLSSVATSDVTVVKSVRGDDDDNVQTVRKTVVVLLHQVIRIYAVKYSREIENSFLSDATLLFEENFTSNSGQFYAMELCYTRGASDGLLFPLVLTLHPTQSLRAIALTGSPAAAAVRVSAGLTTKSRPPNCMVVSENSTWLVLGYESAIQLFSMDVHTNPVGTPPSRRLQVLLTPHRKLACSPGLTYLLLLPRADTTRIVVPDILAVNASGSLSMIDHGDGSSSASVTRQIASSPMQYVTQGFEASQTKTGTAASVTVCSHKLLAVATTSGRLLLYHTGTGVELPVTIDKQWATTACLATGCSTLLAVACKCGRVVIFKSSKNMKLFRVIPSSTSTSTAIQSMLFLDDGQALVVMYREGAVVVADLGRPAVPVVTVSSHDSQSPHNAEGASSHPTLTIQPSNARQLCQCHNDSTVWAVLTKGSYLEVYATRFILAPKAETGVSMDTIARVGGVDLMRVDGSVLICSATYLQRVGMNLIIFAIGPTWDQNEPLTPPDALFVGYIEGFFHPSRDKLVGLAVSMQELLQLGSVHNVCFSTSTFVVIATVDSIRVVDFSDLKYKPSASAIEGQADEPVLVGELRVGSFGSLLGREGMDWRGCSIVADSESTYVIRVRSPMILRLQLRDSFV